MNRVFSTASGTREIAVASPSLDPGVEAVICIPSFRRPQHLRLTLQSLIGQRTTRRFAVVLVENDAAGRESLAVFREFIERDLLQGVGIVEPQQGNCHAINTVFDSALALFPAADRFLMIDDDEIASPGWLDLMLRTAADTGADIVGGPVWPRFDDPAMQGLRDHPAFRPAYDASGPVAVIYGCGNCLVTRAAFERLGLPAFDVRFNFLGGGDTDFFYRCRAAGMTFHWVAEAIITETVPANRTHPVWLALRGLRIGAINYHVQRKLAPSFAGKARLALKVLGLLPLSLVRAAGMGLRRRQLLVALHPVIVAAGGALAAFGIEPQPYRAGKQTT